MYGRMIGSHGKATGDAAMLGQRPRSPGLLTRTATAPPELFEKRLKAKAAKDKRRSEDSSHYRR